MLRHVGAPTLESDLVSDVRLMIGTGTHNDFEGIFRGHPVMLETKLDHWMPEGWSGTADWIVWNDERRAFVLGDLKTIKPEGMHYVLKDGIKDSHLWQVSSYWWALARMGIPLVNGFVVYYLPTGQLLARDGAPVVPSIQEGTPLPQDLVEGVMSERWSAAEAYRIGVEAMQPNDLRWQKVPERRFEPYLTEELAPVQERVTGLYLNKQLKRPVVDLKVRPHWSAEFCPYPLELCNCREQGTNKVGHWDRDDSGHLVYVPRADQPQPTDIPQPDAALVKKLVAAQEEADGTT